MLSTFRREPISVAAKSEGPVEKDPIAVAFGKRVHGLRRVLGITQKELALRASYDAISVSRLENGEVMPKIDTVIAIANALEVTPSELFDYERPKVSTGVSPLVLRAKLEDRVAVLEKAALEAAETAREALALAQRHEVQLSRRRKNVAAS